MSPLAHPIDPPRYRSVGSIGIRAIELRDARTLQRLLTENRAWLEPWEATYPGGGGTVPGSTSMRPIIKIFRRQLKLGASVSFVITFEEDVVGQLTVSDISGGGVRSAAIGDWVARGLSGRGITTAAVALAIDYCLFELQLHRVEICIRPENAASLRVVEKLGMRFEGRRARYIHIAGRWCDHDCFAVTAEEVPRGMVTRLG